MAGAGHALEQALAYYRAPARLAMAAHRPLPDDLIELLRLAAGDGAQAAASAAASGESPERVAEAAVFFVQQVMFAAGADPHRVLGVNPGAPAARIREHYRWLIRWLHPDRNADDWDNVYTDRVTRAWQQLRRSGALAGEGGADAGESAAEAAQDAEWSRLATRGRPTPDAAPRAAEPAAAEAPAAAPRATELPVALARISRETDAAPILSARTARRLPVFVLGGLGLAAVSLVALLWVAQQQKAARPTLARVELPAVDVPRESPAIPGAARASLELPAPVLPLLPAIPAPTPSPVGGPSGPNLSPAISAPNPARPPAPAVPLAGDAQAAPVPQVAAESFGPEGPPTGEGVAAAETEATAPPAPMDEASARAVLAKFSAAYAAGDINALMRLFTRDARNNRGGRDAIVYDYQSLFARSRERRLDLQPNGWITGDSGAVVLAEYAAWVKEGRLFPGSTTRGTIRFTLRREDGELKISQVIHD
ncbi:MAG TPA: J domain-containing protein [Arenimonas sp.]|uniref:J domain-containing protein n=1 Tax=Arenimonas sp. TaxID=1872635 RepID=UPI002D80031C|nr:J domain-containing protein [Arenimonas sp.]HEU0152047.1 J domain-containing protein [Arenimonas sp.]